MPGSVRAPGSAWRWVPSSGASGVRSAGPRSAGRRPLCSGARSRTPSRPHGRQSWPQPIQRRHKPVPFLAHQPTPASPAPDQANLGSAVRSSWADLAADGPAPHGPAPDGPAADGAAADGVAADARRHREDGIARTPPPLRAERGRPGPASGRPSPAISASEPVQVNRTLGPTPMTRLWCLRSARFVRGKRAANRPGSCRAGVRGGPPPSDDPHDRQRPRHRDRPSAAPSPSHLQHGSRPLAARRGRSPQHRDQAPALPGPAVRSTATRRLRYPASRPQHCDQAPALPGPAVRSTATGRRVGSAPLVDGTLPDGCTEQVKRGRRPDG